MTNDSLDDKGGIYILSTSMKCIAPLAESA